MTLPAKTPPPLMELIIESVPMGIIVVDQAGKITLLNAQAEKLFGYSREELINQSIEILVPVRFRGQHSDHRRHFSHNTGLRAMGAGRDLYGLRKDGSEFPAEIGLNPIRIEGDVLVISSIIDITERKRAEEAIERSNIELSRRQEIMTRLLDHLQHSQDKLNAYTQELKRSNEDMEHFAYVTSHDLQEPLRKIISFAEMLEEDLRKVILDETAKQRLRYVVDSARRMRALIQDLLQYSRLGRGELTKETVDSGKAVTEVISVLETQIRDAGAEIRFNSLPRVYVHPGQFRQLLQNLLGNAVKYHAARPPVVEIAAAKKDGEHIFSVKDNGIGFEPEFSARIFEIFQRLHTREEYPGTGIGLAICKKIVERHGGRIWAESEPGKSAVFYFTLPSDEVASGLEA